MGCPNRDGALINAKIGSAHVNTKDLSGNRFIRLLTAAPDLAYGGSRSTTTTLGLQEAIHRSIASSPCEGSTPRDVSFHCRRTRDIRSMTSVFQRISAMFMLVMAVDIALALIENPSAKLP